MDLDLESDKDSIQKWPAPFPDWSIETSAFWNLVWAVKSFKRGRRESDHYVAAACDKLKRPTLRYSDENLAVLLSELSRFPDINEKLIHELQQAIDQ